MFHAQAQTGPKQTQGFTPADTRKDDKVLGVDTANPTETSVGLNDYVLGKRY